MGLEKIEKLRREMGITQKELSLLSGVPLGTLTKIITGETTDPKLETVKAIARVLKCTLDDLDEAEGITSIDIENKEDPLVVMALSDIYESANGDDPIPQQLAIEKTESLIKEIMTLDNEEFAELRLMLQFLKYKKGKLSERE